MNKKLKAKVDIKNGYYSVGFFQYLPCPHCKKMLILSPKKERNALRKWKKLKT
jgi:hypothetical protein